MQSSSCNPVVTAEFADDQCGSDSKALDSLSSPFLLSSSPSSYSSTASSSGPTTPSFFLSFTDLALPSGSWDLEGKRGFLGEPQIPLPSQQRVTFDPVGLEDELTSHAEFWLEKTGTILTQLLRSAKYPQAIVDQYRELFRDVICPALGPRPITNKHDGRLMPAFPSFMCDDHTPIEFGFSPSNSGTGIRFSIEPISHPHEADRRLGLNLTAARRCMDQLEERGIATFETFKSMIEAGTINYTDGSVRPSLSSGVASQIFLAFDLGRDGKVLVKTYLVPLLRAQATLKTTCQVVRDTLDYLQVRPPAVDLIEDYTRAVSKRGQASEAVILSTDAVSDESKARYKLYVRYFTTNFDQILEHLSLGGILDKESWVEPLRQVWQAVLGVDPTTKGHGSAPSNLSKLTGGCLVYYDFLRDSTMPSSKVYLPVRHWADNDGKVARGIAQLAEDPECGVHTFELERGYEETLQRCLQDQDGDFKAGRGRHTYVAVARKASGKFELSVYMNPKIIGAQRQDNL